MSLLTQIEYTSWDSTEEKHRKTVLDFLENGKPGSHITGSAWIINATGDKALLTLHTKLNKWLQPGGHGEQNETVRDTALREAREETGLASLGLLSSGIFDIDVHRIPPNGDTPGHFHYDIRFILRGDEGEKLKISRESKGLRWVSFEEIPSLANHSPGILRMLKKSKELK